METLVYPTRAGPSLDSSQRRQPADASADEDGVVHGGNIINGWINGRIGLCRGPCARDPQRIYRLDLDRECDKHLMSGLGRFVTSTSYDRCILDSETLKRFLRSDHQRVLWIQTDSSQDGLECVIDKLPSLVLPGSAVAYYSVCSGKEAETSPGQSQEREGTPSCIQAAVSRVESRLRAIQASLRDAR